MIPKDLQLAVMELQLSEVVVKNVSKCFQALTLDFNFFISEKEIALLLSLQTTFVLQLPMQWHALHCATYLSISWENHRVSLTVI